MKPQRREEKDETSVEARRVMLAAEKCRTDIKGFFERAALAGTPRQDFKLDKAVVEFREYRRIPKHVAAFADRVLNFNCPKTCPRDCVNLANVAY